MALMGTPHVSGAVARGRQFQNRLQRQGIEKPTQPGEDGFNKNFVNVNGSLTAVPNGSSGGLIASASKPAPSKELNQGQEPALNTTSGLPTSPPINTPIAPSAPVGPQPGLPTSQPTSGTAPAGSNTNNYANTAPTSKPVGGTNATVETIPGTTGTVGQQRVDNLTNWTIDALNNRNRVELGGQNVGGNNINADGSWNLPDFLKNGGLISQFNRGANTDATTRQVQGDETVAGQLAKNSLRSSELNRIAIEDAREGAAAAGMLGGSAAAEGAALRASRNAMLPVAQQDAAWHGQTSKDNMDAINRDSLSDQDLRSGLIGQESQIGAQLYENASDRRWKSKEANHERIWNTMENQLADLRRGTDREDNQNFALGDREDQQDWNSWQAGLQRDFQGTQAQLDRTFQGDQAGLNRAHERQTQFFQAMFGREGTMASILAGIYGNENLTPAQQAAAAANARQTMGELWSSFNATLAQGLPDIFGNPYGQQPRPGGLPQPAPAPGTPAPTPTPGSSTPPPSAGGPGPNGYQQLPNGSWPSPTIGTNPDGSPRYATQTGTLPNGIPIFVDENGVRIPYP